MTVMSSSEVTFVCYCTAELTLRELKDRDFRKGEVSSSKLYSVDLLFRGRIFSEIVRKH